YVVSSGAAWHNSRPLATGCVISKNRSEAAKAPERGALQRLSPGSSTSEHREAFGVRCFPPLSTSWIGPPCLSALMQDESCAPASASVRHQRFHTLRNRHRLLLVDPVVLKNRLDISKNRIHFRLRILRRIQDRIDFLRKAGSTRGRQRLFGKCDS